MGSHPTLTHDTFPAQGQYLHASVEVVFHYDTSHRVPGTCVRDDAEEPGVMIFRIGHEGETPRFVLATECQWRPVEEQR